ncbi:MAG TPA: hypothetical protein VH186_34845 [Chloroflexia bacterium]|nr:hypothetical protein [Chloroflexia bacterium]
MSIAVKPEDYATLEPEQPPEKQEVPVGFHWSMRLMSLVSLFALGLYSYVLWLCYRPSRQRPLTDRHERHRVSLSALAFALDLTISAYFGAATPLILKKGGLPFDRKNLPLPIFLFFAITGFVPTASMTVTVLGGWRWRDRIRHKENWRALHGRMALLAYFSWWLACAPVLLMGLIGERRTIELLKKSGWFVEKDELKR